MEVARTGPFVMLRLEHGEDVLQSVSQAVSEGEATMVVTTGLGMITDFELGYFDSGSYVRRSFDEPHELLSMQGSISSEGDNRVHVHVAVANKEHDAFGGHLLSGKVWMSNEIAMVKLERTRSKRELDHGKKVGILHFIK